MVDMVLGEDMPGYRARGGPLGVPVAWVSLLPRRGRMAEGHVARPLEKKEGRTATEGRSPRRRGGWVGQAAGGRRVSEVASRRGVRHCEAIGGVAQSARDAAWSL